ncbi:PREDICTED: uncharacterized protein LOC108560465 [Nicrophorus vespilloides]|uniref:Uncharacterized protein LOC108560465 n=1 Tax=Nicrophorus vespilloides TaxID=110193 RepID=A0ABM1MG09_NICVS|nr:PREDICTED: uncharacterized protein LOC108560465 [Nicrophorus vespilloides]
MVNMQLFFNVLLMKYFEDSNCVYYMNKGDENIIGEIKNKPMVIFNQFDCMEFYENFACQGFIISSPDPIQVLKSVEFQLKYVKFARFNRRKYLLVTSNETELNDEVLRMIPKVVLAMKMKRIEDCYELFTLEYIGTDNRTVSLGTLCDGNESIKYDSFGIEKRNFMGKVLKLPMFSTPPYVDLSSKKGIELPLFLTFCEKYNFTANMILEEDKWGSVHGNFVGVGALYKTAIGATDLTMGGYYRMEKRHFYNDFSDYTTRSAVSVLVPEPRLMSGWKDSFRSYTLNTWIATILMFVFLVIVKYGMEIFRRRYILRKNVTNRWEMLCNEIFYIISLYLHQSVQISLRIFTGFVILFCIFLEVFYSCRLASIIAKPTYTDVISSNADLEKSEIKVIGLTTGYIAIILNEKKYQSIVKRFIEIDDKTLMEYLEGTEDVAIAVDNLEKGANSEVFTIFDYIYYLGYSFDEFGINIRTSDLSKFRLLPGELSYDYCVFMGTKHSSLMPLLNEHLSRLRESGLIYYYMYDALRVQAYNKYFIVSNANRKEKKDYIKLNFNSIEGVFLCWAIGIAISIVQFLRELYTYN